MARYYLHFTDGKRLLSGVDGLELSNDHEARKEAMLAALELRIDPDQNWIEWIVEVRDEMGRCVASLPVKRQWSVRRLVSDVAQRLMFLQ
jgi:Domain of unknown function (DUF6894)